MLPSAALPSPRGRMRGPPIVRWMAAKGRPEPENDLRTGVVWCLLVDPLPRRQPDVFPLQPRCERIGFDCQ